MAGLVRGLLGTDSPDPTLESASPSPPQGSIWHRFDIDSASIRQRFGGSVANKPLTRLVIFPGARMQIWVCLICVIPTYSDGAVQIRVGLELNDYLWPLGPSLGSSHDDEILCKTLRSSGSAAATLWHESVTKRIPWESFFVILEGIRCILQISKKEFRKWPRSLFLSVLSRSCKERPGAGWDQDGPGSPPPPGWVRNTVKQSTWRIWTGPPRTRDGTWTGPR